MRILVKLLLLVVLVFGIDFFMLNGRYGARVWSEAQRHGQAISTEIARWLPKARL
jgi:hypothetical protein